MARRSRIFHRLPGALPQGHIRRQWPGASRHVGRPDEGRHTAQEQGQPDRHRHQPEVERRQQHLDWRPVVARWLSGRCRRQNRGAGFARDAPDADLRHRALQQDDDQRGVVVGRHGQQPPARERSRLVDPEPKVFKIGRHHAKAVQRELLALLRQ